MKNLKKIAYVVIIGMFLFCVLPFLTKGGHYGIDVSHHNNLKWNLIPNDIHFCYIKLTEGATYDDPKASYHTKGTTKFDINRGYYHYYRTTSSGKEQFEHFKNKLSQCHYDLTPALDLDTKGNDFDEDAVKEIEIFIQFFYDEYKYYPIIYYGDLSTFLKTFNKTYKCKYWFRGVNMCTIHQHITTTKIEGIAIDKNFCRDLNAILIDSY